MPCLDINRSRIKLWNSLSLATFLFNLATIWRTAGSTFIWVFHATTIRGLRHRKLFRIDTITENAKIQSWIYRVTKNTTIDYYRRQSPSKELPASLILSDSEAYVETRKEISNWFLPLIKNLPPLYSKGLVLSEIDGLTHKEIAEREGLTISAVKSRILRGRKILKDNLLQCCHFEFDHQGKVLDYQSKQADCKDCC